MENKFCDFLFQKMKKKFPNLDLEIKKIKPPFKFLKIKIT